jgi:hypothetical protein
MGDEEWADRLEAKFGRQPREIWDEPVDTCSLPADQISIQGGTKRMNLVTNLGLYQQSVNLFPWLSDKTSCLALAATI